MIYMRRVNRQCEGIDEHAIMGEGSLAIFVAVLTAATAAAGVYTNTVDEVRDDSVDTVDQAISEVSTYLNIRSVYGIREDEGNRITHLYLHMSLGPGCSPQNLTHLLIHIDDEENQAFLRYNEGPADSEHYSAEMLLGPEEQFSAENPVVHRGSTVKISINISATELELKPDTRCYMEFTPKSGSTTVETFTTPSVYYKRIIHFW